MKILQFVLSVFLMSTFVFGADKSAYFFERDDYIPSQLSYPGLAKVIDNGFQDIGDIKVVSVTQRKIMNGLSLLNPSNTKRFAFDVVFDTSSEQVVEYSCILSITYNYIESADYYSATRGLIHRCKLVENKWRKIDKYIVSKGNLYYTVPRFREGFEFNPGEVL